MSRKKNEFTRAHTIVPNEVANRDEFDICIFVSIFVVCIFFPFILGTIFPRKMKERNIARVR